MPPRASPVWKSRARSVPVPVPVQAHDTNANINTNTHIHLLQAPKFVNASISISISTPTSTPIPAPSISTSTSIDPVSTQKSSLWSSTYASGAGVKIAGMIDAGLVLVLLVFLGVIFLQWKKGTGSVPSTPLKINPEAGGGDQTQEKDDAVLVQVDSHGNDKKIGTPTLVASSGSASETEHDNGNVRRSDLEEGFLGLTAPGQKKHEEINEKA